MATLEKRETGWRVKVRKNGASKSATFRTKAEALAWATKIEHDLSAARAGILPDKTFGDLLSRYAEEVSVNKRGARAEQLRIELYQREFPELCGIPLAELGPEAFSAWRDKRLQQVSALSVRREWAILQNACNVAVKEWRWLHGNPMMTVKKPEAGQARTRRPSEDEIRRLLLACGYEEEVSPLTVMARTGAAWLFAIQTAMRASEICGLTDETVNFDKRVAFLPLTKNGHSRVVPLSLEAIRILQQVRAATKDTKTIFDVEPASLDALFRKAKARALVEDLHFHDSRREALTRLARKVDVMTLAKISGHRDLRILQNTYYAPDMADVASLLD